MNSSTNALHLDMLFPDYLKLHLDRKTFGESFRWEDESSMKFKISWPRVYTETDPKVLGIMYLWWEYKNGNDRRNDHPPTIKNNFR